MPSVRTFGRLWRRATPIPSRGWRRQVPETEEGVRVSIRTPGKAPAGEQCGPPSEPPYPWRVFVGMLLAILIGGAILAVALGLNPLTFQKFGAEPEATPAALATPVVGANTPAAGATATPAGAAAPAVAPTAIPTPVAAAPQAIQTAAPAATSVARSEQPETAATSAAEPTAQAAEPAAVSTEQTEPIPVQAAVPAELAAAIIQGYDNYWSVRVQASGDPNNPSVDLGSVMADD